MSANTHREQADCDECLSPFYCDASVMPALCAECAHWIYGYPKCGHEFADDRCTKCGWDGSVSAYVEGLRRKR